MKMNQMIDAYLESKTKAWSEATRKSERYRLNAVADVLNGDPDRLWNRLEKELAPYSRVTTWTRVVDFWDWALSRGHVKGVNRYREWRKENALQFKNAYRPKLPRIDYNEALKRINQIGRMESRVKAMQLLRGGLRFTESFTVDEGEVTGKGGKRRKVYVGPADLEVSYWTFLRDLKEVGLTPHQLRKIMLSRAAQKGASVFELQELAGWSQPNTAMSYIKANDERIKRLVESIEEDDVA